MASLWPVSLSGKSISLQADRAASLVIGNYLKDECDPLVKTELTFSCIEAIKRHFVI